MKENFVICIESLHIGDQGDQENVRWFTRFIMLAFCMHTFKKIYFFVYKLAWKGYLSLGLDSFVDFLLFVLQSVSLTDDNDFIACSYQKMAYRCTNLLETSWKFAKSFMWTLPMIPFLLLITVRVKILPSKLNWFEPWICRNYFWSYLDSSL